MAILTNEAKIRINEYRNAFLRILPNTGTKLNPDFNPELPEDDETNPITIPMTESEWIDNVVKVYLIDKIKRGARLLQQDEITNDEVILE